MSGRAKLSLLSFLSRHLDWSETERRDLPFQSFRLYSEPSRGDRSGAISSSPYLSFNLTLTLTSTIVGEACGLPYHLRSVILSIAEGSSLFPPCHLNSSHCHSEHSRGISSFTLPYVIPTEAEKSPISIIFPILISHNSNSNVT